MNKLFTKIAGAALGLTMAIGVGVAAGSNNKEAAPVFADTTVTITKTNIVNFSSLTGYNSGAVRTTTGNDFAIKAHNIMRNAANSPSGSSQGQYIQMQGSSKGNMYNTVALGEITSISVVKQDSNAIKCYFGSNGQLVSDSTSSSATSIQNSGAETSTKPSAGTTMTWTSAMIGSGKTYFALVGGGTHYLTSVSITYSASQTPSVSFSNPTTTVTVGSSVTNTATGTNLGGATISYAASNVSPANCITLNTSTGEVTGNTAGGTARITATATVSGTPYSDYYDISVIELPVYDESVTDWTWGTSGSVVGDAIYGGTYKWRLSESEYYSSGSKHIFGDYSNTNTNNHQYYSDWSVWSAKGYYSSIATAITQNTYGFAMYTQNFSINKLKSIDISWGSVSGLGATSKVYLLASTNGGFSWSNLCSDDSGNSNKKISWSGSTYSSTNNVLVALAFTSSSYASQLIDISIKLYGDSLSTTNVWAVREITVTGNANVEAEQTTTYTATVVTSGYETPANSNINWSSGTTSVATVNSSGVVTGVSVGSASIIATAADGKGASSSKTITVTEKLKRLGTITLNTNNVTRSFVRNSAFNSTGLVVTAHYANGFDDETVTPTIVTAPDMTTAGNNKIVTVSYSVNGTSANATYTIDVTPIVSDTITISGTGVSLVDGKYKITTGPNYMDTLSVTYNGDESEITATPTNESIYYEDGYLMVESTDNDSGTITFTVGNAIAYLDVTVIADEILDYVTPADGIISCVQHQTIGFEFSLVNASEGEWTEPTSSAYTITGTGDETGYIGEITLNEVCTNLEAEFSVETSEDTLTISLYLTASADSITSISVKTNPTKTTYVVGETFSSAGLVVSANRTSGVSRDLASNEINLRNAPTVLNERGSKTITVELVADTSKTTSFTITVNMPSGLKIVTKSSNHDGGFEGTIIESENDLVDGLKVTIGNGDSNDATLIGKWSSGNNIPEVSGDGVSVSDGVYSFTNSNCVYTLEASDSHWKLVDADGRYIYAAGGTGKNNYLKAVAPASVTDNTPVEWDITIDNGSTTIVCADSSVVRNTLMYNNGSSLYSCYASGQTAVNLYSVTELDPTYSYNSIDLTVTIYDFIRAVYNNSDYYTCQSGGEGSSLTNWSNITSNAKYTALSSADKQNLANAVVSSPDGTKNSSEMVADFLSQYDYVVWKYGKSYDYLGRVDAGTASVRQSINLLSVMMGENTNTVAIIVIISMVSMTAIVGYFFLRKRKDN